MAAVSRHLHTPISEIEDMDWERFEAYVEATNTILDAERPE